MSEADECIFCKISRGKVESEKIYENDNFFSILDQNQNTKGHALVISKKHFVNTLDLPNSLGSELLDCVKKTALKVMEENKAGGLNVIGNNFSISGQEVMHFHQHVLPRKSGDDVKFSF